jgi:pimeloyl-ACP methyl ester carboxylesterase
MAVDFSRRALLFSLGVGLLPSITFARTTTVDTLLLKVRDGRSSQVTVWRAARRRGTILFSHGALSSPAKYEALLRPWADAGFDVWAPLHVDSTDHPDTKRFTGLASWPARIEDMRALADHVGASSWVAAGHSYGALVALMLGGVSAERPEGITGPMADPRVKAVVAFSPPGLAKGLVDLSGYGTLAVPALIQTGTRDIPPGARPASDSWQSHLAAYDAAAPGGDRFGLVLDGVDHYFGGIICRPEMPGPKQNEQFNIAITVSALFLTGYGAAHRNARKALGKRVDGVVLRHR